MRVSEIVTREHALRAWAVLAKAAPTHPRLVLVAMRAIVRRCRAKWQCPDARALLFVAEGPLRASSVARGVTVEDGLIRAAPLFAAALEHAGHFRAVVAPTLDLNWDERDRLRAEVETLIETHTTLPELHAVVREIVRAHLYTPGMVRQEKIGAAPWIVETDRGPVRVVP